MAKQRRKGIGCVERMFKILEYLKNNTDQDHPTSQADMRKSEEISSYIGHKQTFNRLIKDLAQILNSDEHGFKKEEDWNIHFDDFKRAYGDENLNEDDIEELIEQDSMHIQNLYYQRKFSYEEINSLIEGILSTKTLDTESARKLIEKVENHLTTKFYQKGAKCICKVREPELVDRQLLKNNLLMLQKAIDENVQIAFRFNGYTYNKQLEPVREKKDIVSPYYIVVSGGRYYLLACKEIVRNKKSIKNMSIWRIDLMTEMEIATVEEMTQTRIPKREVENLPMEWSEDFQLKHLNMSFDKPVKVTLRIKSEKEEHNPKKRVRPDYTFLHDWFGDTFEYIQTEQEAPFDDIVQVECSPYAMVHWALQYSERVEVIEPVSIRNDIIEKIKELNQKYKLQ